MNYLGIDLGTTNCVAAYADGAGIPRSVVNFEGDILTPSALLFEEDRRILVGREALKQSATRPEAYTECFKREIGNDLCIQQVLGQTFRPEFLSAVLLKRLKNDLTRALGSATSTVITVPAYFDESRRRATRNAGLIAGWEVTDIINEPTAAALTYARQHDELLNAPERVKRVLVYDLGGGTFDCTLVEITPGREYRTIATDGEVRLGGFDWDQRLAQHLAEQFQKKTGILPLKSPQGQATFLRLARQLKHALTTKTSADAPVNFEGQRALLDVKRATFESLSKDLLDRTRSTVQLVLEAAHTTWATIDSVVLIGGSSRMPMVAAMLEKESGKSPEISPVIDEAVAHGAAIYAHLLGTDSPVKIVNVNSHTLRIVGKKDQRRITSAMIPRNSPLPASRTKVFPVVRPGQRSVAVEICEGECDDPELCELIGMVTVSDLPADSGKMWKVAVTLKYRTDGSIDVSAKVLDPDDTTRVVKTASVTLVPARGLTTEQIQAQRQRLTNYQIA